MLNSARCPVKKTQHGRVVPLLPRINYLCLKLFFFLSTGVLWGNGGGTLPSDGHVLGKGWFDVKSRRDWVGPVWFKVSLLASLLQILCICLLIYYGCNCCRGF